MAKNLVATNIRLPKEELLLYRQIALEEGKSFSELVREELSKKISSLNIPSTSRKKKRSFWDIDKYAIRADTPRGSLEHDKYIYGDPHGR